MAVSATPAELLTRERPQYEVTVSPGGSDNGSLIPADSPYPVILSQFYLWRPEFESNLTQRIAELVPAAEVSFDRRRPDKSS
ncbi:hypothetical protein [Nocardia aurantiaca]|uniref:Uncharacterized protein n=1 Tax=Nocardia aurantiaca TaxID=2675850 RepID=A0A6I3KXS1_9NOCA|nr:hypothetical protein [Nocardia aurantiaca]MTE14852.1 hypothetical protein [Nocardia aurantiaca]